MKYVVITRSLQTDFQWEQDAINIAQILLELLSPEFPLGHKDFCTRIFLHYVSKYVAEGPTINTEPLFDLQSNSYLKGVLNKIEYAIQDESDKKIRFKFSYKFTDLNLLNSLIRTTISQYYLENQPALIEKVDYLKLDYGDDLVLINHSISYNNLIANFYDHGCAVFGSEYNSKKQILEDFEKSYFDNDAKEYEIVVS